MPSSRRTRSYKAGYAAGQTQTPNTPKNNPRYKRATSRLRPASGSLTNALLILEVRMAGPHSARGAVDKLKLVGRRIVLEAIILFFKKAIHSLD